MSKHIRRYMYEKDLNRILYQQFNTMRCTRKGIMIQGMYNILYLTINRMETILQGQKFDNLLTVLHNRQDILPIMIEQRL